jgi:hypothetical protein
MKQYAPERLKELAIEYLADSKAGITHRLGETEHKHIFIHIQDYLSSCYKDGELIALCHRCGKLKTDPAHFIMTMPWDNDSAKENQAMARSRLTYDPNHIVMRMPFEPPKHWLADVERGK